MCYNSTAPAISFRFTRARRRGGRRQRATLRLVRGRHRPPIILLHGEKEVIMKETNVTKLVKVALIGALYTALTLAIAPISFSTVQFRISEALMVLPLFSPLGIWGVTFGCFFSNLIGFLMGSNPTGLIVSVVGTSATLLAALAVYAIGRSPLPRAAKVLLAPIPTILFNGVIVGLELALVFGGEPGQSLPAIWAFQGISVAAGELVVCYTLGMVLAFALYRADLYKKLFPTTRTA